MLCIICNRHEACYKFGDEYDICDICHNSAIGNYISYKKLNEMYDIDSKSIFSDIRERHVYFENWQKFEAKFLHVINEITNVEQKEYYMHIYNRNYKLREIKEYIVYRYYKHFTYDVSLTCVPCFQFKFGDYLEFTDLSVKFVDSNNKIAEEYAFSSETEEEVKSKLDENLKICNKIADDLSKKANLIYKLIDEEINILLQFDSGCRNVYDMFIHGVRHKYILHIMPPNIVKSSDMQHNDFILNIIELYTKYIKYSGNDAIEKYLYAIDPNICTLNELKKTDAVQIIRKIIRESNKKVDKEIRYISRKKLYTKNVYGE